MMDTTENEIEKEQETELLKTETVLPTEQSKSFYENIRYLLTNITVEPVMITYVMASNISKMAVQNLNLEKVCRVTKNYGDDICDTLIGTSKNTTEQEMEVQKAIAEIEAWRSIISTGLPLIILIYMGAWSDRTGNRKLCVLLPIVGEILVNISNILSTFFFNGVSAEMTMLLEAFFPAVTGGFWLMGLGVFSYITDITHLENRTFRLGLAAMCIIVGLPIGSALCGILMKFTSYYGVFFIDLFINLLIFLYSFVLLKSKTIDNGQVKNSIRISDLIIMQKETALVIFKQREGKTRLKLVFLILVIAVVFGQDTGETTTLYLYSRYRLNWDIYKYSIFTSYSCVMNAIGCLFSLLVFSKWLGWDDSLIGVFAAISKILSSLFTIFANTDLLMFMVPIINTLSASKTAAVRSMCSKLVPGKEIGKMNSLIGLMETVAGLVMNPAYSILYAATMERFTGAMFLFTALTTVPLLGMLLWIFKEHRREIRIEKIQMN